MLTTVKLLVTVYKSGSGSVEQHKIVQQGLTEPGDIVALLLYRFFVRKNGHINFVPTPAHRPSVRMSVRHVSCNCIFSETVGPYNFKLCRCLDHMT